MNILTSALGRYHPNGNPNDADVIMGHSFGTMVGEGSANRALADFIIERAEGRPIIADRMLVNAFPNRDEDVARIVEGDITNGIGQGIGSWGTILVSKDYMLDENLKLPLMVAHARHIGRVVAQAQKVGIHSVVPEDLPDVFDRGSDQIWTRSPLLWLMREVPGSLVLKFQGKL